MKWLEKTGDPGLIDFKLHDFGYRGATCQESAEIGGSAHLVNFMGTDTIAGVLAAQKYYNTDDMLGFSIPAAEHSTITSWGRDGEEASYKNMLDNFLDTGKMVAVVSDSYDLYHAIRHIWGDRLKDQIINSGGTVVVRPDSGEPVPVTIECLKILGECFGSTTNSKGYEVLHPSVRVLQGDSMNNGDDIDAVYEGTADAGFSADNTAIGMGGGLIQRCDRDTYKFAMKCSAVYDGITWKDVYKDPIQASWKKSMRGLLDVDPSYNVVDTRDYTGETILNSVFKDGNLLVDDTFEQVKSR